MKIAILANRGSVEPDVREQFPDAEIVVNQVVTDMCHYFEVAKAFSEEVIVRTKMGEEVLFVLACPVVIGYLLGGIFVHSPRKIFLATLDYTTRKYEVLDVSNHLRMH